MNKEWLDQAKIEASKFWKPLQGGSKHPVAVRKDEEKRRQRLIDLRRQRINLERQRIIEQRDEEEADEFLRSSANRKIREQRVREGQRRHRMTDRKNNVDEKIMDVIGEVNKKYILKDHMIPVLTKFLKSQPYISITDFEDEEEEEELKDEAIEKTKLFIRSPEFTIQSRQEKGKTGGMLPAGHQPPRRVAKITPPYKLELSRRRQNFSNFLIDLRNIIPTLQWLNQEKKEEMSEALQTPAQIQNLFDELDDDNTLRQILTIDNIKNIDRQFYDQTLGEMIEWLEDNLE